MAMRRSIPRLPPPPGSRSSANASSFLPPSSQRALPSRRVADPPRARAVNETKEGMDILVPAFWGEKPSSIESKIRGWAEEFAKKALGEDDKALAKMKKAIQKLKIQISVPSDITLQQLVGLILQSNSGFPYWMRHFTARQFINLIRVCEKIKLGGYKHKVVAKQMKQLEALSRKDKPTLSNLDMEQAFSQHALPAASQLIEIMRNIPPGGIPRVEPREYGPPGGIPRVEQYGPPDPQEYGSDTQKKLNELAEMSKILRIALTETLIRAEFLELDTEGYFDEDEDYDDM